MVKSGKISALRFLPYLPVEFSVLSQTFCLCLGRLCGRLLGFLVVCDSVGLGLPVVVVPRVGDLLAAHFYSTG